MDYFEIFQRKARAEKHFMIWVSIFYIASAITVINSIFFHLGSSFFWGFGLASPRWAELTLRPYGSLGVLASIVVSVIAAGLFWIIGKNAIEKKTMAYLIGLGLYTIDTLLLWNMDNILAMGFRVVALLYLCKGYTNLKKLLVLEIEEEEALRQSIK